MRAEWPIALSVETARLLRSRLRSAVPLQVMENEPLPLTHTATERGQRRAGGQLENETDIFANAAFWRRVGEEFQHPLIVTGVLSLTRRARPVPLSTGQRGHRSTFSLKPTFVFIDGHTGAVIHTETLSEEISYDSTRPKVPGLGAYFDLMDRVVPKFLAALGAHPVPSRRVLLR